MSAITAWGQMIARCYDPEHPKYPRYGGRGIRVCDRWICRRLFLEDMGDRPEGNSLNRINNDGDYCPENCEWASYTDQAQNRHDNRNLAFNGQTACITEWSRKTGIKRKTIEKRLQSGWTIEQALTTPVSKSQKITERRYEDRYVR
jgi:hypothetical protein